jgi:hypothetical protein
MHEHRHRSINPAARRAALSLGVPRTQIVMLTERDILLGVLLPAAIAAAAMGPHMLLRRRLGEEMRVAWAAPLGLGAAFVAAFGPIAGAYPLPPPRTAEQWLFAIAIVFTIVAVTDGRWRRPMWLRATVLAAMWLLAARMMLSFRFRGGWGAAGWAWIGWYTAVAVVWWLVLEQLANRVRHAFTPLVLTLIAAATSVVLIGSGTAKLGKFGGSATTACAVICVYAVVMRRLWLGRGTMPLFTTLMMGLIALGYYAAEMTLAQALTLLATPLYVGLGLLIPRKAMRPWLHAAVRLLLIVVPLGIVAGMAVADVLGAMREVGYEYEYE